MHAAGIILTSSYLLYAPSHAQQHGISSNTIGCCILVHIDLQGILPLWSSIGPLPHWQHQQSAEVQQHVSTNKGRRPYTGGRLCCCCCAACTVQRTVGGVAALHSDSDSSQTHTLSSYCALHASVIQIICITLFLHLAPPALCSAFVSALLVLCLCQRQHAVLLLLLLLVVAAARYWGLNTIRAPQLWARSSFGGRQRRVAVIDSVSPSLGSAAYNAA
jgi:hypothetical protein